MGIWLLETEGFHHQCYVKSWDGHLMNLMGWKYAILPTVCGKGKVLQGITFMFEGIYSAFTGFVWMITIYVYIHTDVWLFFVFKRLIFWSPESDKRDMDYSLNDSHQAASYCTYCVSTYLPTYLHMYVRTYVHTYIHTYLLTYIHTYLLTYILTYLHPSIHPSMHACIHTYIH